MQDSTEYEFPFLQEVYTPREAHKIEYRISLFPSMEPLLKLTRASTALSSSMA